MVERGQGIGGLGLEVGQAGGEGVAVGFVAGGGGETVGPADDGGEGAGVEGLLAGGEGSPPGGGGRRVRAGDVHRVEALRDEGRVEGAVVRHERLHEGVGGLRPGGLGRVGPQQQITPAVQVGELGEKVRAGSADPLPHPGRSPQDREVTGDLTSGVHPGVSSALERPAERVDALRVSLDRPGLPGGRSGGPWQRGFRDPDGRCERPPHLVRPECRVTDGLPHRPMPISEPLVQRAARGPDQNPSPEQPITPRRGTAGVRPRRGDRGPRPPHLVRCDHRSPTRSARRHVGTRTARSTPNRQKAPEKGMSHAVGPAPPHTDGRHPPRPSGPRARPLTGSAPPQDRSGTVERPPPDPAHPAPPVPHRRF